MKRSEYKEQQHKKSPKQKSSLMKKMTRFIFIGLLLAVLCGLLILNIFITFSDVSKLEEPAPRSTFIYAPDGEIISKISNSNIEGVSIDQIPQTLIDAVVSVEDQRFYKHHGVNYLRMGRALIQNAFKGKIVAGGSTITQQLAKNVFLTEDRTYSRKFKELILAKKIERTYSKDEIMERYLNQIYFGDGSWGVQRAAQNYFGKDINKLTLSESATLAGVIKAPTHLSPTKNMEKSLNRRNLVLSLMLREQYITREEYDDAVGQKIVLADSTVPKYKGKYPYYIDRVIDEAVNTYHLTKNEVLSGGLHIYTEINPVIQDALEAVYKDDRYFPKSTPDQLIQSASVFLNPKTGGISALVGGRGEYTHGRFNNATKLIRQPGSALKPLAVYTPALEKGYRMSDLLLDEPINIDGYSPKNFDQKNRGQVTMYDALAHSYNIPPVWLLDQIGIKNGVRAVERFGIPLEKNDHALGLALGGMDKGTSPLRMAQAFSAFANNGVMVDAHAIAAIKNSEGKVIGKWREQSVEVTDAEVAQQMTYMLQGAVEEGTAAKAQISGMEVAGKTGTTQLPFSGVDGSKDHWFVGYTPDIAGAVWLGYDQTDSEHYLTSTSSFTAPPIFAQVLSRTMSELPTKKFDLPLIGKDIEALKKQKKKLSEKERIKEKEKSKQEKKEEKQKKKREKKEKFKKEIKHEIENWKQKWKEYIGN
ncbi:MULTISPECIES: transglycosylase domain-containing protein [unclassified Sporosarcina]|uniref:transglycosylase domain-containing protein n=1 Tax=unclassified Sporosarcina TaxID=2647733 RepID=UPI0020417EDA|nr:MULTISPECIES: PBP1A family penicillin-binding protein [unclassified Sporosarcina]GKV65562.1 penicillin-binding protein 2A [Sporosarcina sp. NCCP-2331]GLB55687.1 penicillin-binding protein 2A [Sporosarcina sp. NCCP-2378]